MDIQLSDEVSQAYLSEVGDILRNKEFLSLSLYEHHQWTTRFMHSINVSYISWKLARKFGCDEKVAARAGLLHDFCPYDFHKKRPQENIRRSIIPKQRLRTAKEYLRSTRRKEMRFFHICFPWDRFLKTEKHGSSPWQTKYVLHWRDVISRSHWPDATAWS
mgnify:CR=1 FL=1